MNYVSMNASSIKSRPYRPYHILKERKGSRKEEKVARRANIDKTSKAKSLVNQAN